MKEKLRDSREVLVNTKEWQLAETPEERETRLQQVCTNQHERLAVETPKERELRLECYSICSAVRLMKYIKSDVMRHNKCSYRYLMKGFIPSITILSELCILLLIHVVFYRSLRLQDALHLN